MDLLLTPFLGTPLWMWGLFLAIVLVLLTLDLGLFHKEDRAMGIRESLWLSAFYITLGLGFAGFVAWQNGAEASELYLTAFLIEKTLALDNLFVIALIFGALAIPPALQHRVLFWGILGVIVLRGIMIGAGAALVQNYAWVLYVFAVFLILTGVKMLFSSDEPKDLSQSRLFRWAKAWLPVTPELHGNRFFVRGRDPETGRFRRMATPLFLALVLIEGADLIFAVDSVPAVFMITSDPFLVYTSNIFAILGLRALYFALAAVLYRFHYLKYALGVLLVFVGSKIFIADALGLSKFPADLSLGITLAILGSGIALSLYKTRGAAKASA